MLKEVQMTLRIEPQLRTEFADAVALEDRPAAQVLRELMRAYIAQVRERGHRPANDAISAAERRRREHVQRENAMESLSRLDETGRRQREEAVNYARASVQLEGFDVPEAYSKEAERFIRGEIDFSALTAKVHELAGP